MLPGAQTGWRKPGASKHHAGCPTRLLASNRQERTGKDSTAHWHCGTHGEVGIGHTAHPRVWEKRQVAGSTTERFLASQSKPVLGDSKSGAQSLLQAPLWLLADPAPSSGEKLKPARLQPLYRECELAYELLQEEFTAWR